MKDPQALTPRHNKNLQQGQKKIEKYVFSMNRVIGKGSYATVYLGRKITDDTLTAVKVIDKKIFANTYNIKSIQLQIDIMKKVDHPNIVKLLDVYQTNNNMYIVTQFCQGGDLRNYIRKKKKLTQAQSTKILNDLVSGFQYLHNLDIIHRDLKPANILLQKGVCKISDFGFAKNLQNGETTVMKSIVGTPLYMSPQILNKGEYTNKSDLWSIGLIFYEMIYGQTPWPANNQIQLLNSIMTRAPPFNSSISEQNKDFIKKCLKIKQQDRMSWQQAFKHPIIHLNQSTSTQLSKQKCDQLLFAHRRKQKQNRYETTNRHEINRRSKSKSSQKKSKNDKQKRSKTPTRLAINVNIVNGTPSKSQHTPTNKVYTPRISNTNNVTPDRSPWKF